MSAFDQGVASFDPTPTGVLLWTRTTAAGVRWEVALDSGMRRVVAGGEAAPDPASGCVTVDVDGLRPATTYWYSFEAGGERSTLGRTRTLPDGRPRRFRLALVCCARYSQSPFTVYRAVAHEDVDLVVHLGDYVYEDDKAGIPGREPDPPHPAVTADDYLTRHAQHRRDPDLRLLHARHPMVVLWDDHDLADNAWSGGAKSHDPETEGPWEERRRAALAAAQAFLPKRLADPGDLASAWRCFDAGGLVRLVCTETRVAGRDQQAGAEGAPPADDPSRSLLGDTQRSWLLPVLEDPGPTWVVVASGTVVSELELPAPDGIEAFLPEKYEVADGVGRNTDQWDGYRAERERVAAALAARGGGAVVVSGDIHSSWAVEGPDGPDGPVTVEAVCPPAATTPIGQLVPGAVGEAARRAVLDALPHVRWLDVEHHGYVTLDVDAASVTATWWWVDPRGAAQAELGAAWAVRRERPGRWEPVALPAGNGPTGRRRPARWLLPAVAVTAALTGLGAVLRWRRRR